MKATRDILVLTRNEDISPRELENEISFLEAVIADAERKENFCVANEIIDVNQNRIYTTSSSIVKSLKKIHKPFVFVCNKN